MTSETTDVVVIRAGVQGLSAAYHLARAGVPRVLILEKTFMGAGSSGRSAGMFMLQRENEPKIRLSLYSRIQYKAFEAELGVDPGYRRIGFLSVATEAVALRAVLMAKTRQELGVATEILGPEDIRRLVPVVNTSDLVVGVFGPQDGMIDPHAIMSGYLNGARRHGAEIRQGVEQEVVGIEVESDRVIGVATRSGRVGTGIVVNAAGAEAGAIAAWVGVKLPITNTRRSIFVTDPFPCIPDDTPMVEDAETK